MRLLIWLLSGLLLGSCCLRSSPPPEGPGIVEDSKRLLSLYSPDKKKLLTITENGNRSTQVAMTWPCGGSSVYLLQGVDKKLSAYWKNNSTVVIETFKSYVTDSRLDPLNKRKQVQFVDDIVKIEYIEK